MAVDMLPVLRCLCQFKVGFDSRISSKKANRWLEKSPASKLGSVSLRSGWAVGFTIASAVRRRAAPNP